MIIFLTAASFLPAAETQERLRRTVTDSNTGMTFSNFRSGENESVFYQVLRPVDFLYREPSGNADPVYSLSRDIFVEVDESSRTGSFVRAKVLDRLHGVIEGWVRMSALRNIRYYGRSYSEHKELSERGSEMNRKINPHWVISEKQTVYGDSAMTVRSDMHLNKGDIVYVKDLSATFPGISFYGTGGHLLEGFVPANSLSELAVVPGGETDMKKLISHFSTALLKNGIDKPGFMSYSGIRISELNHEEFTEDRICRELPNDSLFYGVSNSLYPLERKRFSTPRNDPSVLNYAMYRFLPDEQIVTSNDTISCRVIELVTVPRSAKMTMDGIEHSTVSNSITRLYITRIENHDMDIVFHKEISDYTLKYAKDTKTGKMLSSESTTEKLVKRLTAFRKH